MTAKQTIGTHNILTVTVMMEVWHCQNVDGGFGPLRACRASLRLALCALAEPSGAKEQSGAVKQYRARAQAIDLVGNVQCFVLMLGF